MVNKSSIWLVGSLSFIMIGCNEAEIKTVGKIATIAARHIDLDHVITNNDQIDESNQPSIKTNQVSFGGRIQATYHDTSECLARLNEAENWR